MAAPSVVPQLVQLLPASPIVISPSIISECLQRERRCARALRAESLQSLSFFAASDMAHIISPITRNGCIVCSAARSQERDLEPEHRFSGAEVDADSGGDGHAEPGRNSARNAGGVHGSGDRPGTGDHHQEGRLASSSSVARPRPPRLPLGPTPTQGAGDAPDVSDEPISDNVAVVARRFLSGSRPSTAETAFQFRGPPLPAGREPDAPPLRTNRDQVRANSLLSHFGVPVSLSQFGSAGPGVAEGVAKPMSHTAAGATSTIASGHASAIASRTPSTCASNNSLNLSNHAGGNSASRELLLYHTAPRPQPPQQPPPSSISSSPRPERERHQPVLLARSESPESASVTSRPTGRHHAPSSVEPGSFFMSPASMPVGSPFYFVTPSASSAAGAWSAAGLAPYGMPVVASQPSQLPFANPVAQGPFPGTRFAVCDFQSPFFSTGLLPSSSSLLYGAVLGMTALSNNGLATSLARSSAHPAADDSGCSDSFSSWSLSLNPSSSVRTAGFTAVSTATPLLSLAPQPERPPAQTSVQSRTVTVSSLPQAHTQADCYVCNVGRAGMSPPLVSSSLDISAHASAGCHHGNRMLPVSTKSPGGLYWSRDDFSHGQQAEHEEPRKIQRLGTGVGAGSFPASRAPVPASAEDEREVLDGPVGTSADPVIDDGPLALESSLAGCEHIRSVFNSTKNMKRRIHTYLFWRRLLGFSFPICDSMLRDCVWRNLDSCCYGIKQENGHPKVRGQGACINPLHYNPITDAAYTVLLDVLVEQIGAVVERNESIELLLSRRVQPIVQPTVSYQRAGWNYLPRSNPLLPVPGAGEVSSSSEMEHEASDKTIFIILCRFLRQMPVRVPTGYWEEQAQAPEPASGQMFSGLQRDFGPAAADASASTPFFSQRIRAAARGEIGEADAVFAEPEPDESDAECDMDGN